MVFCRFLVSGYRKSFWPDPVKRGPGAHVAQSVERVLGKDEVISSILIMGSINVVIS